MQNLLAAVYTALTGDAGAGGVNTLTSGRIYEGQAEQDAALPLLVFNVAINAPLSSLVRDDVVAELQVDVYHNRALGLAVCRTLAERVRTVLNRANLTATGWTYAQFYCIDRGITSIEEDAYRITQRYKLWAA